LFDRKATVRLRFRHRYEVNPKYIPALESGGLVFSGRSPLHPIMQILELPREAHPYFLATQAHPELSSRPLRPQPMFVGLVAAALRNMGIVCSSYHARSEENAAIGTGSTMHPAPNLG